MTKHEEPLAFTLDFLIRDHLQSNPSSLNGCPSHEPHPTRPRQNKKPLGRSVTYNLEALLDIIRDHDDQLSTQELEKLSIEQLGFTRSTFYAKLALIKKKKLARLSLLTSKWNSV